jgi:hypothetical protein
MAASTACWMAWMGSTGPETGAMRSLSDMGER